MSEIEGVATARIVGIAVRRLRVEAIPGCVIEPSPRERRALLATLAGMVEDHIDDHLDAGRMQRADHVTEFVANGATGRRCRGIARLRTEISQGVVAPVVNEAACLQVWFIMMLVHRQQAHRRNAESLQVGDRSGLRQTRIAAAQQRRHIRMTLRETLHMQLVEDEVFARMRRPTVLTPIVVVVHHPRTGRLMPFTAADDLPRPRIEQQARTIEPLPDRRLPAAVRIQSVEETGRRAGQIAMPDIAVAARQWPPLQLASCLFVEDTDFDLLCVRREHGEVDPRAVPVRAERLRTSSPQLRGPVGHGCRSRNTVASGGSVSAMLQGRPCAGIATASAPLSGVPRSLPP